MTLRIWIPYKRKNTCFSQAIAPSDVRCFPLKNYLPRWNILEIFHPDNQFGPMKTVPTQLFATGTRFCKFPVISVFSNWLYSSERKLRNAGNFWTIENFKFSLSGSQRLYLHVPERWFSQSEFQRDPNKLVFINY